MYASEAAESREALVQGIISDDGCHFQMPAEFSMTLVLVITYPYFFNSFDRRNGLLFSLVLYVATNIVACFALLLLMKCAKCKPSVHRQEDKGLGVC